jgi:hypothetical protein
VSLTTTQLFNLTPAERAAAINTIAGEAYQGAGGADIAAVTANLLSRRLANYGGNTNLVDIVKAPGQYEANFDLTRDQIINPNLISKADQERIGAIFDNPALIKDAYQKTGGALSFRGTANYKYRRGDEYTPVEGKSNFYFDPLNPETYQKGLNVFSGVQAVGPTAEKSMQSGTATDTTKTNLGSNVTNNFLTNYIFGSTKSDKKEDKPKSLVDQLKGQLLNQALGLGQQQRSLSSRLIDSMKNSPYGGYLNPSNALYNMEDYFSRLF